MTIRQRFNPSRGGHAPGHMREMLYHWIDESESIPVPKLLGKLWNCTDTLPSTVVSRLQDFGIDASSVARAVRAAKARS